MSQPTTDPRRIARGTATALALLAALGASAARAQSRTYDLTIESHVEVRVQNQPRPQEIDVAANQRYVLTAVPEGVEVRVESLGVRVGTPAHSLVESKLNRSGASFRQGDQPATEYDAAKVPPELKEILGEFGKPLARISLDASGAETGRKLLVEPTTTLVEHGVLDNCRLFHPPFPADSETWDAPVRVSLSSGQFAAGTLHYEKAGKTDDGLERVRVAGELKASGKVQGGEIGDALYKVNGDEFFDPEKRSWVSGLMKIDLSFKILTPSQPPGSATGTMEVRLRRVDGDAATAPPGR